MLTICKFLSEYIRVVTHSLANIFGGDTRRYAEFVKIKIGGWFLPL